MSAATNAKSAGRRASIALEILARSKTGQLNRNFDDCFEMMDGDEVVRAGIEKLKRSARYRAGVARHGGVPTWVEFVAKFREPPSRPEWNAGAGVQAKVETLDEY